MHEILVCAFYNQISITDLKLSLSYDASVIQRCNVIVSVQSRYGSREHVENVKS